MTEVRSADGTVYVVADAPPAIDQLAVALVGFQAELPSIAKAESAQIETKKGGTYGYKYADLADVSAAVLPLLSKHGMAWICTLNGATLTARLVHVSGQKIESTWHVPANEDPKAVGSLLTYGRRYLLMTMTGVHPAGEDDDGAAAVRPRGGDQPKSDQPNPLTEAIRKGREAGLTDERIRADLDEMNRVHSRIKPEDLRALWHRYARIVKENAEAATQRPVPETPPTEAAASGGPTPETAAETPAPAESDPWAKAEPVDDGWMVAGQPLDEFADADPDADAVLADPPAEPDDPPVGEHGATQADRVAARNAVEDAKTQLAEQLQQQKAKRVEAARQKGGSRG